MPSQNETGEHAQTAAEIDQEARAIERQSDIDSALSSTRDAKPQLVTDPNQAHAEALAGHEYETELTRESQELQRNRALEQARQEIDASEKDPDIARAEISRTMAQYDATNRHYIDATRHVADSREDRAGEEFRQQQSLVDRIKRFFRP